MSRSAVLITGAGSSSRMGSGLKKEYRLIGNVPVLVKSILEFQKTGLFSMFVVTVPKNHIAQAQDLIRPFVSLTGIEIVEGGAKRQDSVWKGLCAMEAHDIEYVLIHDAARPWVSQELICTVFAATEKYGACIPVVEISDAVVELDEEGFVSRHLSKASSKGVQTPEGFHFNEIFAAHREARDSSRLFHDDAEILMHTGKKVFTIPGRTENKKITYSHDLESL